MATPDSAGAEAGVTAASKMGAATGALATAAARAGAAVPPSSERAQMRMTASAAPPIIVNFAPSDMGLLSTNAALSAGASDGIHGATAGVDGAPGETEIGNILGAAERIGGIFTAAARGGTISVADGSDGLFSLTGGIDGVFAAFVGIGGGVA